MGLRFDWITDGHSRDFAAFSELYEASFPEDEREPTHKFVEWIKPVDRSKLSESSTNYLLGAFEDEVLQGFLFYCFFPNPCFAFFVYIAVRPDVRGHGIATIMFKEAERHCEGLAKSIGKDFLAVVGEVERIQDALDDEDRVRRELRLKLFDRLGLGILSPGYTQPALTEDSDPVPLNLMWKKVAREVNGREIALAFYDLVFELGQEHPYVVQTLEELQA